MYIITYLRTSFIASTILIILCAHNTGACVATHGNSEGAKKALIFGVTGQDGSYLTELLLDKGYEVHGVIRRSSGPNTQRLDHIIKRCENQATKRLQLHYGDVSDDSNVLGIIDKVRPHEIYNLAAQSHVKVSFEAPEYTSDVDGIGTLRILDAIKKTGLVKHTKFYQASTSELYGKVLEIPQKETTPFNPRSPYAAAKAYAFYITKIYRDAYDVFACNGILFNHESPRRGETFVTRKITLAVAARSLGNKNPLYLGNLDASRDWGYAGDYVEAMWMMLQQAKAEDFVIATGKMVTVRRFVELAYQEIGITIRWQGTGVEEVGIDKATDEIIIKIDPENFRPAEVDSLVGDASKAEAQFGWKPKTSFEELVKLMVREDIAKLKRVVTTD